MIVLRHKKRNAGGFIAVMSAIILSAILLLLATASSHSAFYTRFNVLDTESKEKSAALALGCIEKARLAIALGHSYIGEQIVTIGDQSCTYNVLSGGKITAQSLVGNSHTYYKATVNEETENMPITYFEELSTYP